MSIVSTLKASRIAPTTVEHDRQNRPVDRVLHGHRRQFVLPNVDRAYPFSWVQCCISLVSYILLLTDTARAGLGVSHVTRATPSQPDTYVFFGPYAYSVNHLTTENATATSTTDDWVFKFDTTSIAMRATARFLALPSWLPCLLYQEPCRRSLSFDTVFHMFDDLVDGLSHRGHLTARIRFRLRDRLHHYAFPWFFELTAKRTTRVIHDSLNPTRPLRSLCTRSRWDPRRPLLCDHNWRNLARFQCRDVDRNECQGFQRIDDAISYRVATLAATYPNHTIDYVVLDSIDDYTPGGISFQGRQYADVVLISRVRRCPPLDNSTSTCQTIAVDDFRVESVWFTMNAPAYFPFVAALRLLGQVYAWLRLGLLVWGCYLARAHETKFQHLSWAGKAVATLRTVFLIPSQVIIYGSLLPITLYAIAHVIDSAAIYELISAHYIGLFGVTTIRVNEFVRLCAVSMRAVWCLGLICHLVLRAVTTRSWSPMHSVPGTAELSITMLASATIFAQLRMRALRDSRVLAVDEVTPNSPHHFVRSEAHGLPRSWLGTLLVGTTIDVQCILCALVLLAAITWCVLLINRVVPRWCPYRITAITHTVVPYSAGLLWSTGRLVVSWFGMPVARATSHSAVTIASAIVLSSTKRAPLLSQTAFPALGLEPDRIRSNDKRPQVAGLIMRDTEASQHLQCNMHSLVRRTPEMACIVYIINLPMMVDPVVHWRLRWRRGTRVALYQSIHTQRFFLLPFELAYLSSDIPIEWTELTLVATLDSTDLEWQDLLRCG